MSGSDYLELEVLDHVLGGADYVRPATVYLALSTTTPTDAGGNFTEPSGNGYARVAVTNNPTNWPAAAAGLKSNGTEMSFEQATGSWGTVTHFGIYDALTVGNLLFWGALGTAKVIENLDTPKFAVGDLDITAD